MVEKIAGFLGDNALTRSWAETMDRGVITPIELQFVKEMPPKERFNAMATRLMDDKAQFNERGLAFIDAVRMGKGDSPELRQQILSLLAERGRSEHGDELMLQGLWDMAQKAEGKGLKKGLDVLAPRDGVNGYTELGRQMRQMGLGSPVAAYSAVTAGGALGTAGAIEAYDWWLAQQQQQQKDSELPLS